MNEEDYQKSFNDGYILQQFEPQLAEHLASAKGSGDKINAFKEGREQFINETNKERKAEKSRDHLPDFLKLDRFEEKDIDANEPDRNIEPER